MVVFLTLVKEKIKDYEIVFHKINVESDLLRWFTNRREKC